MYLLYLLFSSCIVSTRKTILCLVIKFGLLHEFYVVFVSNLNIYYYLQSSFTFGIKFLRRFKIYINKSILFVTQENFVSQTTI